MTVIDRRTQPDDWAPVLGVDYPDTAYTVGPDDHPSDSRVPAPEERPCCETCQCIASAMDDGQSEHARLYGHEATEAGSDIVVQPDGSIDVWTHSAVVTL